jgi:hypothetical protein
LSTTPVLATRAKDELLLLYIAATAQVVSTILVIERDEPGHIQHVQRPVYLTSEVLSELKVRYP